MRLPPMPVVMFEYRDLDGRYVIAYADGRGCGGPHSLDGPSGSHRPDRFDYYFTDPLIRLMRAGELD